MLQRLLGKLIARILDRVEWRDPIVPIVHCRPLEFETNRRDRVDPKWRKAMPAGYFIASVGGNASARKYVDGV